MSQYVIARDTSGQEVPFELISEEQPRRDSNNQIAKAIGITVGVILVIAAFAFITIISLFIRLIFRFGAEAKRRIRRKKW